MVESDVDKLIEAIMKAHLLISIARSTNTHKQAIIAEMKEHSTHIMELVDKLLGEQ